MNSFNLNGSFIVGILFLIVATLFIFRFGNRDHRVTTQYDERQLLLRGHAYKYAFYTLCFYECLMFLISFIGLELPLPAYLTHFCGIILACLVLGCYCIWNDVYFGLNNDPKRFAFIFLAIIVLNLVPLIPDLKKGTFLKEGIGSSYVLNLVVLSMLAIFLLVMLLKHLLKDSREENES